MHDETTYLTAEKHAELTAELETLMTNARPDIARQLEHARALGDLSENAEYHQARQTQGEIEARIKYLARLLKHVEIVTHSKGDTVAVGSTVVLKRKGEDDERTYNVVGSEEADTAAGKISLNSPLGSAMMGKKKGEVVTFTAPSGKKLEYTILKIS